MVSAVTNSDGVLIAVKGLSKTYVVGDQEVRAVQQVDLEIRAGEYVAIMGSSGSGKSTLMNMLGCLDTPSEGTYRLNGTEVSTLSDDELAAIRNREIGFIFQTFNLLSRSTAAQNVELPLIYAGLSAAERSQRVAKAIDAVGLSTRSAHKPNELSGGQRQRVAIARALVNNPSLILADEPTGNLDSVTSGEIMDILDGLVAQGHTVIIVTHENDIADRCRRVICLSDGRILSDKQVAPTI
ncbi:MAG: putative ABC transport system ATP-binding protein [Candidatus Krumholzibacteriia bacterium]|jgi:putative ABC transport system ATP-binding protein